MRCAVCGTAGAAEFYQGKQVTIVVGFSSAGTYDATARLFARHLGKHLPGKPTVIVRNMPGAGSLVATNSLYGSAPKDGTTLGVIGGGVVLEPLLGNPQATYDPRRFNWIGGRTRDNFLCLVWHTVPVHSLQDVTRARNRRRRDRPGLADADLSEGAQRIAGHEIQDRVRLSRRQRDHARPGARRGRRLLRLGARQHQDPRAGLDPRRQDPAARAVHAWRRADLPNVPLATDLARNEPGAPGYRVLRGRFRSGLAAGGAAGFAGGARCRASRGIRRDDAGPAAPRRGQRAKASTSIR